MFLYRLYDRWLFHRLRGAIEIPVATLLFRVEAKSAACILSPFALSRHMSAYLSSVVQHRLSVRTCALTADLSLVLFDFPLLGDIIEQRIAGQCSVSSVCVRIFLPERRVSVYTHTSRRWLVVLRLRGVTSFKEAGCALLLAVSVI